MSVPAPPRTSPDAGGAAGDAGTADRELLLAAGSGLLLLAATSGIGAVFIGSAWRPPTWAAIVLATAVAAAARRLRLGAVAAAVASGAVWAVFTYVTQLEGGGLLPGSEQLRELLGLWSQGLTDVIQEPAPARPLPGLVALTASGTWWLAHLTHELLVRVRRPGVAATAASVLWLAPLAAPQPPSPAWPQAVPFLAAAALVLLLEPDPDLAAWRRPAGRSLAPSGAGAGLAGAAIVLALAAPTVLPGYGAEPWFDLSMADAARGYQPIVDVSRRLKLPETRDLLRVETTRPLYLRLAGLDTFDGHTWRLGPPDQPSFSPDDVLPADRRLPVEVEIREAEPVQVTVQNVSLENVFVPVPYHPVRVEGSAARRMVYSREGTFVATSDVLDDEPALVPGLSYGVVAAVPDPRPDQLRRIQPGDYARVPERWLALPGDYPQLAEETDAILTEAGAGTAYDVAFTLQQHFRSRFRYSTDVAPLRSADALTRFVTTDRVGYCEYFATAMAVMLRLEGIPARVAVGFRLGDQVAEGTYVVTTDDAHAWVEVLFPGYGWIQFEPTPALGDALVPTPDDITPDQPVSAQQDQAQPRPSTTPTLDEQDLLRQQQQQPRREGPVTAVPPGGRSDDGRGWLPAAAALLVATLGAASVAALRRRDRHHPGLPDDERVLRAQRRVLAAARWLSAPRRPSETAVEVAHRWAAEGRVDPTEAARFAALTQAAAFGGQLAEGAGQEAEELADALTDGLRGSVGRGQRLLTPARALGDAVATGVRRLAAKR